MAWLQSPSQNLANIATGSTRVKDGVVLILCATCEGEHVLKQGAMVRVDEDFTHFATAVARMLSGAQMPMLDDVSRDTASHNFLRLVQSLTEGETLGDVDFYAFSMGKRGEALKGREIRDLVSLNAFPFLRDQIQ
jgi:hypothetical protein